MTERRETMIVYGLTLSPFVRKVVAFAAEKGLSVAVEPSGMGRGGAAFEEASPFRKMPGFRDPGADHGRDFTISDSSAITAYLDAKHPETALIPAAPIARARTIWFDEFADTILIATGSKLFFNRLVKPRFLKQPCDHAVADAAEADELPPIMDYLERVAPDAGGFLIEDRLTLADLAVASPFANFRYIGLDLARWPRTVAWADSVLARPSFAGVVEQDGRLIAGLG